MEIKKKSLVLGYGNLDRQDDGIAWHILVNLASRFGFPVPEKVEDVFPIYGNNLGLVFTLQLMPEIAEQIAAYERVCFVDAHTGNVPHEINIMDVRGEFQTSPFTHHTTPSTCLALSETLYASSPEAILISVRGYEFGFDRSLSSRTMQLVPTAVQAIYLWIMGDDNIHEFQE
jgi:hydrogenase maturation protease